MLFRNNFVRRISMLKIVEQLPKYDLVVKKSKFLAIASRVITEDEARLFYDTYKDDKATHNCWAYRIGTVERYFDDGEVSGTAGRPILSSIKLNDLDDCAVLVIRHYGGIKLGTGGLMRAYSDASMTCLRQAERVEKLDITIIQCIVPLKEYGAIQHLFHSLQSRGVIQGQRRIDDASNIHIELQVAVNHCDAVLGVLSREGPDKVQVVSK